jgi:hypothetical protein
MEKGQITGGHRAAAAAWAFQLFGLSPNGSWNSNDVAHNGQAK